MKLQNKTVQPEQIKSIKIAKPVYFFFDFESKQKTRSKTVRIKI